MATLVGTWRPSCENGVILSHFESFLTSNYCDQIIVMMTRFTSDAHAQVMGLGFVEDWADHPSFKLMMKMDGILSGKQKKVVFSLFSGVTHPFSDRVLRLAWDRGWLPRTPETFRAKLD